MGVEQGVKYEYGVVDRWVIAILFIYSGLLVLMFRHPHHPVYYAALLGMLNLSPQMVGWPAWGLGMLVSNFLSVLNQSPLIMSRYYSIY